MSTGLWKDVSISEIEIGDVLRVKLDAYQSSAGKIHNGRIVKVLKIKDGDVHVSTVDLKLPYMANARHASYRLEKKVAEL